ncbi:MAG: leucine-rich repeat domain-containing protein [Clostridia bacterium]|nr:leucine-rich repeat domain-containing protein [Clostridia bacterium]
MGFLKTKTGKIIIISAICLLLAIGIGLTILFISLNSPPPPEREIFTYEDFEYIILDNGTIELISYLGSDTKLYLPSSIDSRAVTSIGEGIFYGKTSIGVIHLGYSVTSVGRAAFYGCSGLYELDLGEELVSIGESAFYECATLGELNLPETLTSIGDSAFYYSGIESITLPDGIKSIPDYCFAGCERLTSFDTRGKIETIGVCAFYGCNLLESVKLDGVKTISDSSFYSCPLLKRVELDEGVSSIGKFAFGDCEALEEISCSVANPRYSTDGGVLYDRQTLSVIMLPPKANVQKYILPPNALHIEPHAFADNESLTTVTLSPSLKTIGEYAFYNTPILSRIILPTTPDGTSLDIPRTVKSIGSFAFGSSLVYNSITDEFTVVGDGILIKYYTQADGVGINRTLRETDHAKIIKRMVNEGGASVERVLGVAVTIPAGVKSVSTAFSNNRDIVQVNFPSSILTVSASAFEGATFLERVDMSTSSITSIGAKAFASCSVLSELILPTTLTEIGEYVFAFCQALDNVVIPPSLTYLSDYMFAGCTKLASLTLPTALKG